MSRGALLEAVELVKDYRLRGARRLADGTVRRTLRAVDEVSLTIEPGRTLAVVGESGSGKSTTARMILGIEDPSSGTVRYRGEELSHLDRKGRREFRRDVQAVFQDPYSSLDPRMRVWSIIAEPVRNYHRLSRSELRGRAGDLLRTVGLDARRLDAYPHDFSGGQRQRIALARALALEPRLIVLDEPISALDVSIGAQMMNLLRDLQDRTGVAYLLIAHDLATVRHLASDVAVMYRGRIVERGGADALYSEPLHPYTQLLMESARAQSTGGDVGSARAADDGTVLLEAACPFAPRCPQAFDRCRTEVPRPRSVRGREVECHLYEGHVAPASVAPAGRPTRETAP